MIRVFIAGNPATQGSKRHIGRGIMLESCKRLPGWRQDVRAGLLDADGRPLSQLGSSPILLKLDFVLPRPKSAPKKKTPPAAKKPDFDKLTRAICDAITTAGIWNDDSQVVEAIVRKRVAQLDETPGCYISIEESSYA